MVLKVVTKPFSRCGECSCHRDREDVLEYTDERSDGLYHTPKVVEENTTPLPVLEPTLLPVNQSCPPSDQENIPPHAVSPPPLNVLVPIMEEEVQIRQCCWDTLAVHSQRAVHAAGRLSEPYCCPACMQLASASKIIATLQDSFDQRRRHH